MEKNNAHEHSFVISHEFDVPRAVLWKTWTDVKHMEWWGPKEVTIHHAKLDFQPGGIFHYAMRTPDGREIWGKWVIREIQRPDRFVFVNSFSDAAGGITRHPMIPNWPREILSTIAFAEQNGKTRLTVQWAPLNATELELKTFDESHDSMQGGWTGSLDRLVEYLAKHRDRL